MEIELITTKKKLTKSIVNQMREAPESALKGGAAIGYVIGIKKGCHKAIIIKYGDEFFTLPANYIKLEHSVYRKIGKWSQTRKFDTPMACDLWWDSYQKRIKEAATQIYI